MYDFVIRSGNELSVFLVNYIVVMYVLYGKLEEVVMVFIKVFVLNVFMWCFIIFVYVEYK